jgi:hypothetical protein
MYYFKMYFKIIYQPLYLILIVNTPYYLTGLTSILVTDPFFSSIDDFNFYLFSTFSVDLYPPWLCNDYIEGLSRLKGRQESTLWRLENI